MKVILSLLSCEIELEPSLYKIVTMLPLLEVYGRRAQCLSHGSTDEPFFVLDLESHKHDATQSVVIIFIHWLCDKHVSILARIMEVKRLIHIVKLFGLRLG